MNKTRIILISIILVIFSTLIVATIYQNQNRALNEYQKMLKIRTQERDKLETKYLEEKAIKRCPTPIANELGPSDDELLPLVVKQLNLSKLSEQYIKNNLSFRLYTQPAIVAGWKSGTLVGDPKTNNLPQLRINFIYPIERISENKIKFDYDDQEYTWWQKVAEQCK